MDNVFFIDDDPQVLKSFTRSLTKKNIPFGFHFYPNCEEAMASLATLEPVCIIADKRLPAMGGEEFLRLMGEEFPGVYRILVSADRPTEASLAACDLYLEKPVSSSTLLDAVHKHQGAV